MAALTWLKEKSEASTQKLIEAAQAYKNLSEKFNKLKSEVDDKGNENARLKKRLEELEVAHSAQEAELKEAQSKAEYYEDKSMSMNLFTTVKVRAEMVKDYTKGRMSAWNPEAAFSA